MDWIKNILIKRFVGGYIGGFFKRMDGYKTFIASGYFLLRGVAIYLGVDPSTLDTIDTSVQDHITIQDSLFTQELITNAIMGVVLLWGMVDKVIKALRKSPQVPNEISKKPA